MKCEKKLKEEKRDRRAVREVKDVSEVPFLKQAGEEMGVTVKVLASAGQPYEADSGYKGTVREDGAFIEVQGSEEYRVQHRGQGLTPFWARVREIREASSQ